MNLATSNPQKHIFFGLFLSAIMLSSVLYAADWQTIEPPGAPSAREGHSMVNLPDGRVLLFGGEDAQGTLFNDLYAFADNDWAKLTPDNQPTPMSGHSMTAMPDDNIYFVFGGKTTDGYSNDIYEYNQNTNDFTKREPQGDKPPGRANHNAFENEGDLWIFGGRNETGPLSDCWVYSSTQNEWIRDADAPHPIEKSCMWKKGDALVFYRAGGTQIFNLETSSWSTAGTNTEYRTAVASAQIGNNTYFMGGNVTDEGGVAKALADTLYSNETVVYNTETSLLDTAASLPYGIANAAAAAFLDPDDNKEKILLFGGRTNDGSLNTQTFAFTPEEESSVAEGNGPEDFRLSQNYPNPFNPGTVIAYQVDQPCRVTLKIYDVQGREIETLKDSHHTIGSYQAMFNASGLPSGIYFYKIEMAGFRDVKKMVKLQ